MPSKQQSAAGDSRNWPFTFRVTREERRLLRRAAIEQQTSVAEIVRRSGLDCLLSRLSSVHA